MTHPEGGLPGLPGHPEPEPVPSPDPEPPQPIPPDEPIPVPEPPHALAAAPEPSHAAAAATEEGPTDTVEHPVVVDHTQVIGPQVPFYPQAYGPGYGPPPGEPIWAGPQQPWQVPMVAPPPPPRRRGALWVSLALVGTLLLCGGGAVSAFFLLRDADSTGAPDAATAVNEFLTAVYTDQDVTKADELVCRQARDKTKLSDRISEIKTYSDGYTDPVYRWEEPTVAPDGKDSATVAVKLTMSTSDEKTAKQDLKFTVIRKTGWLVCDVAG